MSEQTEILEKLQGNIVRPHARDHCRCIFLTFTADNASIIRKRLQELLLTGTFELTTAARQAEDAIKYRRANGKEKIYKGILMTNFFLSYSGYRQLKLHTDLFPKTDIFRAAFKAGMKSLPGRSSNRNMNDPPVDQWESNYNQDIHALLILADDDEDKLDKCYWELTQLLQANSFAKILFVETGKRLYFGDQCVEPFGFVDGIGEPAIWKNKNELDLEFLKNSFLFKDSSKGYGSLLVFRKYEQDTVRFQQKILELKKRLGVSREIAEAQVVGRFKDGTPLLLKGSPGPVKNVALRKKIENFDNGRMSYGVDKDGLRCPFHAHIRKVNPRTGASQRDHTGQYGNVQVKYRRQIIRRGIPYETEEGTGMLFMSYQTSIRKQFEHILNFWTNTTTFPNRKGDSRSTGIDPLIGQLNYGEEPLQQKWLGKDGENRDKQFSFDFHDTIRLKGGEYFFAPSLNFIEAL